MKLFKDPALTEPIQNLDLGIVAAGETAEFTFYVYNDTLAEVKELVFKVENSEVKIIRAPKELKAKKSDELVISWSPSVTLKQGLSTRLGITGIELWS